MKLSTEDYTVIMDALYSAHESWEGNEEQKEKQKEIAEAMNAIDAIGTY